LLKPDADVDRFNRTLDEHESSSIDPDSTSVEALGAWWLRRLVQTPHPLLERMTLLWHSHFAASNAHVGSGWLMYRHIQMLRRHALGCFAPLLAGIVRDPAMLLLLDAGANRKSQPTQTFARALLEEYTLGPGQATPTDVRETARALTGWFVLRNEIRFLAHEHDTGTKTLLGQTGPWTDEDVVRILLRQRATARLLVRRCYRYFISEIEEPASALLEPLVAQLAGGYDLARLVETMLRSNLFFSPRAYRARVKGPVDFAVGLARSLEAVLPTGRLFHDLAALGQHLGQPPTRKGWPGGLAWINRATLIGYGNLATALLAGGEPYGEKLNPLAVAGKHGHSSPQKAGRFLLDLLLQGDVPEQATHLLLPLASNGPGNPASRLRRLAHALVTLPEYHLS
jgi:uncharacterized protein (DUF1800 family)